MLVQDPKIRGPVPKITPLLINALENYGCIIKTIAWGRHSNNENIIEKIFIRIFDLIKVRKCLKNQAFDVLVVHTAHNWFPFLRDIPLLLCTRNLVPKSILQLHGSNSNKLVSSNNFLFKFFSKIEALLSDALFLLSSQEKTEWEKFFPKGKYFVVNNPFVPNENKSNNISLNGINSDVHKLLFVGRLIESKGIFDLLEAFTEIIEVGNSNCHLIIAGDGPQKQVIQNFISNSSISNKVFLTGYLSIEDLNYLYQEADIFVLPTYHQEGFPTVLAEAMSNGLPIITTETRGAADHLISGKNALFVPSHNPKAIKNAIITFLKSPELRNSMGISNKEKIKEFLPEKVAKEYYSILLNIIKD